MSDEPTMRAVCVAETGGIAALGIETRPRPKPGRSEFLIEVRAAALNHADLYQRDGKWPAPAGAPDILGVEVAGIVATADPSGRFTIGTPVMGLLSGGGYAEYAAMDAGLAVEIPCGLSFAAAAALPEAMIVGHSNLVELGGVQPDSRVLIHGGASGMGSLMI